MVRKAELKVVMVCLVTWLTGCQTTSPLENEFFSQSEQDRLPPIQLFISEPSPQLQQICEQAGTCYQLPGLAREIHSSLQQSDVFADIFTRNGEADYQVYLSTRSTYPSNAVEQAALGSLSGLTLMLVPIEIERAFHCEWRLTWHGLQLAEYRYRVEYPERMHLFDFPVGTLQHVADYCSSRFIHDVQMEGAFDPRNLFSKLQASDYQAGLSVPERAGPYIHSTVQQFHHPLLGINALYVDLERPGAHANLFVYPIRRTEWQDVSTVIQDEILVALEDIDLLQQEGQVNAVDFEKPKPLLLENGGQGWQVQGRIQNLESEWCRSALYIFLQEDKFIKVRISEPETAKQEKMLGSAFLAQLMAEIKVPAESLFMARVRQEQRKKKFD